MSTLQVLAAGTNVRILPGVEITGGHRMAFGNDVFIGRDAQIMIGYDRPAPGPMITFGNGTSINRRALIVAVNEIVFGEFVLTAPGIFVGDASHEFRDVGVPITMQGLESDQNRVVIGSHSWLGIHAAIIGNLAVGVGAVIGANSVVTSSIPDYCVAAGQPARVLRAYDDRSGEWEKVTSDDHLADILAKGRSKPIVGAGPRPKFPIYAGPTVTIGNA